MVLYRGGSGISTPDVKNLHVYHNALNAFTWQWFNLHKSEGKLGTVSSYKKASYKKTPDSNSGQLLVQISLGGGGGGMPPNRPRKAHVHMYMYSMCTLYASCQFRCSKKNSPPVTNNPV